MRGQPFNRRGPMRWLSAWRHALRTGDRWAFLRRWLMRDAELTPRAREIQAALETAIARRRAS